MRVLSGTRRWSKSKPLIHFLAGVISSLANEYWKQHYRRQEANVMTEADCIGGHEDETYEGPVVRTGDMSRNPETEALASEALSAIEALFDDDPIAWGIVAGKSEGLTPKEIQEHLEITSVQYASALKKIRRRMSKTQINEDQS